MVLATAGHGHLELVQWLCGEQGFQMDPLVMGCAAMARNLALMQWLRNEGGEWDARACVLAACGGHLQIVQRLRTNGCPWGSDTCRYAVDNRHVETRRWARENGCPWDVATRDKAAELEYPDHFANLV